MRHTFAKLLELEMNTHPNIFLLTGDLGFGVLDRIKNQFPKNFYNVGAAEQLLIGAGIGLANQGKIPICYSITPFLLGRPFELIRNYINREKTPVKLVGVGRDQEYEHDGFSHYAGDDEKILSIFTSIKMYRPETNWELEDKFLEFIYSPEPAFLSLSRFDK